MKLYQRACLILAHEGVTGLYRRGLKQLFPKARTQIARAKKECGRLVDDCAAKTPDGRYADVTNHIIVSGTGRAGTTLLMKLFTKLGLDTGFTESDFLSVDPVSNGGLERNFREPNLPYIVKSPNICGCLDDVLLKGQRRIDHAIVPIREVYSAAESRREVARKAPSQFRPNSVPGGLYGTAIPEQQEEMLEKRFYKLIYTIAKHNIPLTLLHYPRLRQDTGYLYKELRFMLNTIDYESFQKAFHAVHNPDLGHDFVERTSL